MHQTAFGSFLTLVTLFASDICVAQTPLPYKNYAPTWSTDGSKIAFYSSRDGDWEIYTIRSDGTQLTRLTHRPGYDGEPSWSPDGDRIVFSSDRDGDTEIYVMDADGGNVSQLTHNNVSDDDPVWSPVGSEILYRRSQYGTWYVRSVSTDGTNDRQLSDVPAAGRANWSRDATEIVFVVDRDVEQLINRVSREGRQIGIVRAPHAFPGNPSFSPNHDAILYDAHADGIGESGDGQWELWSVSLDGSVSKRLTSNDVDDWGGAWSADGSRLVYAGGSHDNRGYEIFVADASGKNPRRLTGVND